MGRGGVAVTPLQARIHDLESAGNTVIAVARGPRLLGALAFGDRLRPGARDLNDDLRNIPTVIRLSQKTRAVLWQNIALTLGIKGLFLVLAVFGSATMWMAVFADMAASLLVVANGLRLLRVPERFRR